VVITEPCLQMFLAGKVGLVGENSGAFTSSVLNFGPLTWRKRAMANDPYEKKRL